MIKKIFFFLFLILVAVFLGHDLNPVDQQMFTFHDVTQPARIQEFTLNLKNLKIPPRIAPDFSFRFGYPVFNFYAPFTYWVSSSLNILGLDVINSLKISFILAITLAFIFSFLLLQEFFSFFPSLGGAILYVTSLYVAVDIFVRGNLGETWFITLFPLVLYFLYKNAFLNNRLIFFATVIVLSFIFTTHNILSLIFLPLAIVFSLLNKNLKLNLLAIFLGLLLASYFLLPAVLEEGKTYASEVATQTHYQDHFLCAWQLWQSPWGYGGSAPGCQNDGLSFKVGKAQLILGFFGLLYFFFNFFVLKKTDKNKKILIFFFLVGLISLFLTTYQAKFIWDLLSPLFSLFQFPWRFIGVALIGIVFTAAYFFDRIRFPLKEVAIVIISFAVLFSQAKYFSGHDISKKLFTQTYLSNDYIETKAAYEIPEYLPKTANYLSWRKSQLLLPVRTTDAWTRTIDVKKPGIIKIDIHYFPFWSIFINGQKVYPTIFDPLGRPILTINKPSNIVVKYIETPIEKTGNFISLITLVLLFLLTLYKPLWKKLIRTKN